MDLDLVTNEDDIARNAIDNEIEEEVSLFFNSDRADVDLIKQHFAEQSLSYIAGYVSSKIERLFECKSTRAALFDCNDDPLSPEARLFLDSRKSKACYPSNSVYQLIIKSELVFQMFLTNKLQLFTKKPLEEMCAKIISEINPCNYFPVLKTKCSLKECYNLMHTVIKRYVKVRCLSFTKTFNQNLSCDTSMRNFFTKLILYQNQ